MDLGFSLVMVSTVMFRRGYLSEAASSTVWMVKDGTVHDSPHDKLVHEGLRFGLIVGDLDIPLHPRRIAPQTI